MSLRDERRNILFCLLNHDFEVEEALDMLEETERKPTTAKKLLELITIVYWKNSQHCGSDFDVASCKNEDGLSCPHYDFCMCYKQVMEIKR